MSKKIILLQDPHGKWITEELEKEKKVTAYRTKKDAISGIKKRSHNEVTVVVYGFDKQVKAVEILRPAANPKLKKIKSAPVRHRRTNEEVNLAIVNAIGLNKLR